MILPLDTYVKTKFTTITLHKFRTLIVICHIIMSEEKQQQELDHAKAKESWSMYLSTTTCD